MKLNSTLSLIAYFLLSSIFFPSVSMAQLPVESTTDISQYTLENGLTVILKEDHQSKEVFGIVVCKAGAKNDPADATGMAHYQEHMLFKGTQELGTKNWEKEEPLIEEIILLYDKLGQTTDPEQRLDIQQQINKVSVEAAQFAIPNEFSTIIKSMGGTMLNANTSEDRTVYFNRFPSNQINKWLDLYAHRFIHPVFRLFQSELEVVYEEYNMANDMFAFPLIEEFNKKFFKNHPYGQQSIIGTTEHLKNPPMKKMIEFFETYYVPNNMALILVGDFNTNEIKPVIEEKFGIWKPGEVPAFPDYSENAFNGRELIEARLSPIKLGILGFRTMPVNHPDEPVMAVLNMMLSNPDQTGLMDQLMLDNKILASQIFSWPRNDLGQTLILFIPKIVGQKLEQAEALVIEKLNKIKKGDFEESLMEAQKKTIYKNRMLQTEDIASLGQLLAEAYQQGFTMDEFYNYPEKIKKVSKEDVVRVANTYFNDNYLAFHSKMGFRKPEKISQPGFEPVASNTDAQSPYRQYFEKLPSNELHSSFIDFGEQLDENMVTKGIRLFYTPNTENDIYSFKIRFGVGDYEITGLKYASYLMNYCGTETMNVKELKNAFNILGCSYSIYSDDSYLTIDMSGLDETFEEAFQLIMDLINHPVLDEEKISLLYEEEKATRKMERADPDAVAEALFNYILYGDQSTYIDRLPLKEIKTLETQPLIDDFKKATAYEADYFYSGTYEKQKILNLLKSNLRFFIEPKESKSPIYKDKIQYSHPQVYLVNKKKANQSKIYFFMNGKPFNIEDDAVIKAFNTYFGRGFSGLVLQEIREYRSMAYSAGARYKIPHFAGKPNHFVGYIGTQADKTLEAIDVFMNLLQEMPQKPERMDFIRDYLQITALSKSIGFRKMNETILGWKQQGYETDPAALNVPEFKNLSFDNIMDFYEKNIKGHALVIAVVGNLKQFNYKKLEQYGTLHLIKEKELYTK